MKLTDEQMELYRTAFLGGYLQKWEFEEILSSEQAWKEERDQYLSLFERIKTDFDRFSELIGTKEILPIEEQAQLYVRKIDQLNQAIEVIRIYSQPFDDICEHCDSKITIDDGQRARDFLSSLQEDKT